MQLKNHRTLERTIMHIPDGSRQLSKASKSGSGNGSMLSSLAGLSSLAAATVSPPPPLLDKTNDGDRRGGGSGGVPLFELFCVAGTAVTGLIPVSANGKAGVGSGGDGANTWGVCTSALISVVTAAAVWCSEPESLLSAACLNWVRNLASACVSTQLQIMLAL